ncbi:polyprenyl synthetase family protein [Candidatus Parcubacteria bacterium]|nr:polyprenyl synthetase family protein [Candidatus Parcubacteria bacterium]
MEIEDHLTKLKKQINIEIEEFFKSEIKRSKFDNKPEELIEMIENLKNFTLSSGKRIRPILFYFGYILSGGKNKSEALKTSIAIEIIHSYLLIHDDIIDQDDFRHGSLSMHYKYKKEYESRVENGNLEHFGISMGIVVGDLASILGYKILTNSDFSLDLKNRAIKKLNQIVSNTIAGEALDVMLAECIDVKEERIFEMQKYKTAKYTIEGPLHLGAILAGADENFLNEISEFAIPMGIAFQIKDDIIGVFGDKDKIGKPVGSDLKEGKKTLLIAKVLENVNENDRNFLMDVLGNENIDFKKIEKVRKIIIDTGSLKYSEDKAEELISVAKKKLDLLNISDKRKKFLIDLSDYIVKRDH